MLFIIVVLCAILYYSGFGKKNIEIKFGTAPWWVGMDTKEPPNTTPAEELPKKD